MAVQNEKELYKWLCLINTPKLPHREIIDLIKTTKSLDAALHSIEENNSPHLTTLKKDLNNPSLKKVELCLHWLNGAANRYALPFTDQNYPVLLREISVPPLLLFVEGNLDFLKTPQLAIVGSRNATPIGQEIAYRMASQAATAGLTITSGLARGIDGFAHRGALTAKGKTIGVTATGLDRIYPVSHSKLFEQMRLVGAIVSEFIPTTPPLAAYFPQRNRIISGLSLGTLVVEASLRSGSLVTARFALEQGREVFAIPGSLYNPLAQGCHALVKQGAILVETLQDILLALPDGLKSVQIANVPINKVQSEKATVSMADNLLNVLNCVDYSPTPFDIILQRSALLGTEVNHALLILELEGQVALLAGGYTRIAVEKA